MVNDEAPGSWWSTHVDLIATVVISLSAILTAWSAFQASQWNTEVAQANNRASAARLESTRFDLMASQDRAIDVSVYTSWLGALNTDMREGLVELTPGVRYEPASGTLSGFIYERVRPEFRPAFDAWLDDYTASPDAAPSTPFVMEEYRLANAERAVEFLATMEDELQTARDAGDNATNYLLTTLGFALVLFFGGVSTKLDSNASRSLALSVAIVFFVAGAALVVMQPRVSLF